MFFDTHAHLDDATFDAVRDEVMQRAHQAGVREVTAVGTTADASERCVQLAAKYDGVYAAVGIQPNHVAEAQIGDWDRIVAMLDRPRVVALGETGLDRYWDYAPFDLQQDYFDRHLRASQRRDLAFVVHMRDCGDEVVAMLQEARRRGPLRGVMHSFSGDGRLAEECLALGLYLSFAGMVTFKKSSDLRAVAAQTPADRLLIETDCPYLSPEPVRGRRPNEPSFVRHTGQCLADARGIALRDLAAITTENAHRLFGIP